MSQNWVRFWQSVDDEPLLWTVVVVSGMWATERVINSLLLAIRGCPVLVAPRCACQRTDDEEAEPELKKTRKD